MKSYLINKIKDKSIRIGIIGLGYVGLPLAKRFIEKKFEVVGFDVDKSKIKMLNSGKSYINHISHDQISILVENGFRATDDFEIINSIDAIIMSGLNLSTLSTRSSNMFVFFNSIFFSLKLNGLTCPVLTLS